MRPMLSDTCTCLPMHYYVPLQGNVWGGVCLNMTKEGLKYNKQTLHRSSKHMLHLYYAANSQ